MGKKYTADYTIRGTVEFEDNGQDDIGDQAMEAVEDSVRSIIMFDVDTDIDNVEEKK